MKVAVVGAGVSGLVTAHLLATRHDVVVFEAASWLGGHVHTVDVAARSGGERVPVDTGFIVFNERTYPNFVRLLARLGVATLESDMSFSARSDRRDFEYAGGGLNELFAQRRNLFRPRFYRMLRDVLRFYREARALLAPGSEIPLSEFLSRGRYSAAFVEDHLLPMVGAVWSSNRDGVRDFPARFLARFFDNHGFLQVDGRPRWLVVRGGSREYVRALVGATRAEFRTSAPVERIRREDRSVLVTPRHGTAERFDHVVLACHADQALAMLTEPTAVESALLSSFAFQSNDVVLHADDRLMPKKSRAWASWNYHLDDDRSRGACVTYWMNRLQSLAGTDQFFVTLNRTAAILPGSVIDRFSYSHPVFTSAAVRAQERHAELVDHHRVSVCGAWWRNGFHEDGVVSAMRVAERLGVAA